MRPDVMLLSHSFQRKVVATVGAAIGFTLLYEVHVLDSRQAAEQAELRERTARPAPGARLRFSATAYCKGELTASGTPVRTGIAAADPSLLPVGSVVHVDALGPRYNGIYTVMDTGPAVQGRELDLYMWSCQEALAFGRRDIRVTVLRLGWNPRASDLPGGPGAPALRPVQQPVTPTSVAQPSSGPPSTGSGGSGSGPAGTGVPSPGR